MNLTDEFIGLIKSLEDAQINFAVCGGMALALHGFPRYTNDIDLLILPKDLQAALLAAKVCGFVDEPDLIKLGQQAEKRVEICRMNKVQGEDFLTLDLVLVTAVLEDVWRGRTRFEWRDRSFDVVAAAGLARMKLLAGRPQDLVDVQSLGFALDDPAIQP